MAKTQEELGKEGFDLHQTLIANEEARRLLLAKNAAILARMYDEDLYQYVLGDDRAPWAAYLAELKIFYTRNQIDSFIKVYRKFTKELGIPEDVWIESPVTRLVDILPIVNKDNWEDYLIKSRILTTKDWMIEIRQAKGLLTEEEHEEHDDQFYRVCKQCGRKRILEEDIVHNHG